MFRYDDDVPSVPDPGKNASASTDPADTPSGSTAPSGGAEPDAAARQRDEYYDLLLRKTAEFDNYRKRVERERRELAEFTAGEFVKELLPVLDDFARAMQTQTSGTPETFRQGVELIQRRLYDALARRGVAVIDPLGEPFDPHQHEAVARVPATDHKDGEIVEVFSRGYKLGDRLLRAAMVKVATA